ncbi:hypothetical protein BDR04DRAFT_1152592 [Suillus decipiens]|nr:hypothetical protein BDR04DRAFT_1152592 [Suillus decipiens]
MIFRHRRPTIPFIASDHRSPIFYTRPVKYTRASDREWMYIGTCPCHQDIFSFGKVIRLQDQSDNHLKFAGKISQVLAHYKDHLIVNITPLDIDPEDPYPPQPIQLTVPLEILHLPQHIRLLRLFRKCTKRLPAYTEEISEILRQTLKELRDVLNGNESFGTVVEAYQESRSSSTVTAG